MCLGSSGELQYCFNARRPKENGRYFADDIFQWIFWKKPALFGFQFLTKFVPEGPVSGPRPQ